jgi:hypothetical protein
MQNRRAHITAAIPRATNGRQTNFKDSFNVQPKIAMKLRVPTVKMEGKT